MQEHSVEFGQERSRNRPMWLKEPHSLQPLRLRDRLFSLWRGTEGVSAVELAFAMPFLALLIIGMVDYGTAFVRSMALGNAVHAGVQYAMARPPLMGGDLTGIRQTVLDAAPAPKIGTHDPDVRTVCACNPSDTTFFVCGTGGGCDELVYLQITLTEQYPLILSYPGFSSPITLNKMGVLRLR